MSSDDVSPSRDSRISVDAEVASQSSKSESNRRQSSAGEECRSEPSVGSETDSVRRRHSAFAAACVDENWNIVGSEVFEFAVSSVKRTADTNLIPDENYASTLDVRASGDVVESLTDNFGTKGTAERGSPSTAAVLRSDSGDTWHHRRDMDNLLHLSISPIPDEELIAFNDDNECKYAEVDSDNSDVDSYVEPADLTSVYSVHEESSQIMITDNDEGRSSLGRVGRFAVQKTNSKFALPARTMSRIDRKARPVPLPRSKTFRTKSASEMLTAISSHDSIPVQYETCSSIQSKICQTMALGDECESEYAYPAAVNFSEIYVDHKTVDKWQDPELTESAEESDYDVLTEFIAGGDVCNVTPVIDTPGASADVTVFPTFESEYDVLREDIWTDALDADSGWRYDDAESPHQSGLPRTESGYDVLNYDMWTPPNAFSVTKSMTESDAHVGDGTESWSYVGSVAKQQPTATSRPVDVCVEESIILLVSSSLF